ncbi:MAG: helix-turn-helix transcriptional regulator [Oscillospiraceae bacterium]|jgi:DNA-binding XRE family transcriptional regulator|nr:helix-turn-helix transcriptional regulator [Oscillospiraceae bacterium]
MTATIYIYDTEGKRKASCSLSPDPNGCDDGGREYTLPNGYELADGKIFSKKGVCSLQMHNDMPLLIDKDNKLAFLLQQVRKIELCRKAAGMTRQELADKVGLTQYDIYQLEYHEVEPGSAILGKIAAALGCETMDLT